MIKRVYTQAFAVVGAILEKEGKILLVKEAGTSDVGKWNQPAGWLDPGHSPIEMVKQEVKEETGFEFEPTGVIGIYSLCRNDLVEKLGDTPHAIKLIFCGKIIGGEMTINPEEIADVRWFDQKEIDAMDGRTLRDMDIKQEIQDYFAGRAYPLELIRHTIQQ